MQRHGSRQAHPNQARVLVVLVVAAIVAPVVVAIAQAVPAVALLVVVQRLRGRGLPAAAPAARLGVGLAQLRLLVVAPGVLARALLPAARATKGLGSFQALNHNPSPANKESGSSTCSRATALAPEVVRVTHLLISQETESVERSTLISTPS